jgi:hypothetical protein
MTTIDPLTVWHFHDVGHRQSLTRPLTPDHSIADVIPGVLDAARRQRAGEPRPRRATRLHRRVLRLTWYRPPSRMGLNRATQ